MPVYVFATLVLAVVAMAGLSIALVWMSGINFVWLGLAAILAALVIRLTKR